MKYFIYIFYILMGIVYIFLAFWIDKETEFYGNQVCIGGIYLMKFSLLMTGIFLFMVIYYQIKEDF